jgi:hypothetical protein
VRDRDRRDAVVDVVAADEQRLEPVDALAVVVDVEARAAALRDLDVMRPPRHVREDRGLGVLGAARAVAIDDAVALDPALRVLRDADRIRRLGAHDEQAVLRHHQDQPLEHVAHGV